MPIVWCRSTGSYQWSGGKSVSVFDCWPSVITDTRVTGWGEVCPLAVPLPAYANGVRGIVELRPHLIKRIRAARQAQSPNGRFQRARLVHRHRRGLLGHLSKVTNQPVCTSRRPPRQTTLASRFAGNALPWRRGQLSRGRLSPLSPKVSAIHFPISTIRASRRSRPATAIADANTGWLRCDASSHAQDIFVLPKSRAEL